MENPPSGSYFKTVITSSDDFDFTWTIDNFKNLPQGKEVLHPDLTLASDRVFYAMVKKSSKFLNFEIVRRQGSAINVSSTLCFGWGQ